MDSLIELSIDYTVRVRVEVNKNVDLQNILDKIDDEVEKSLDGVEGIKYSFVRRISTHSYE
jgi:hypothetical protein